MPKNRLSAPAGYQPRNVHTFHAGNAAAPTYSEAYKKTPARNADFTADVIVPAIQALITATISAMLAALAVAMWGLSLWTIPSVGLVSFAVAWGTLLRDHRALLWAEESVIREPTPTPEALPAPKGVEISATVKQGKTWKFASIPAPNPRALKRYAHDLTHGGAAFSERGAAKYGFIREDWIALRDALTNRGMARWNHPTAETQGVSLTSAGKALMREISTTTLPETRI